MSRNRSLLPNIAAFAKYTGSSETAHVFAKNFFFKQSQCQIFTGSYFEAPGDLEKYIAIHNLDSLFKTINDKKGALLLGAHFGPLITAYLLAERGLNVKAIFGNDWRPVLAHFNKYGLAALKRRRWKFMNECFCLAGVHEKQILTHLKSGGIATMLMDVPQTAPKGLPIEFLGTEVRLSLFPYKVGLKYEIPVFFYFVDSSPAGFTLRLERATFSTAEEGAGKYADYFAQKILQKPHLWGSLPTFVKWPLSRTLGELKKREQAAIK